MMRTEHCAFAKLLNGKCVATCHRIKPGSGIDCIGNLHSVWLSTNFKEVPVGHMELNENRATHKSKEKKYVGRYK